MGKVRIAKRCRLHLRTGSGRLPSSTQEEQAVTVSSTSNSYCATKDKSTVAPLPQEVMERVPVLSLNDSWSVQLKTSMKKKDRLKLRHETWLKKIDVYRRAREEAKASEERKKTVVVGDMQPLINALPDLSSMEKISSRALHDASRRPHRAILREVDHFQEVLKHPAYKEDPLGTISQHIQNSLARGLT